MSLDSLVPERLAGRFVHLDARVPARAVESAVRRPDSLGPGPMRLLETMVALAAIATALLIGIR